MTVDEKIAYTFAGLWLTLSAIGGVLFAVEVHPIAGLIWAWLFVGLAAWAAISRIPPRTSEPERIVVPDYPPPPPPPARDTA